MTITYIIIIGTLVFLGLIGIVVSKIYNKFQLVNIKITEAENNIDILLEKKYDLIDRSKPIIKKDLKKEEFIETLSEVKESCLTPFEVNILLKDYYNQLFKEIDDNEKILKNNNLIEIIDSLNTNEVELSAAIKYYNDNVTILNELITKFPSNIIRLFFGYKKKEFYSLEKREVYEILKSE